MTGHLLTTLEQLDAHYGEPSARAIAKEIPKLNAPYRAFIEHAPFVALATSGPGGLDCSPRGDAAGFVRVLDDSTLAIPDRPGNNRVDSLRNIVRDPRVGLLFLVPGAGETLRVNGRAAISVDPDLVASFAVAGKKPRAVLLVTIETVYFQCSKALMRSKLWDPALHVKPGTLPSAGAMIAAVSAGFDSTAYDAEAPARLKQTMY